MNSIWIDLGVSLFSGCIIAIGLVQVYRYYSYRNYEKDLDFVVYLFGDTTQGKPFEQILKKFFFSGIFLILFGAGGVVALYVFF